MIFPAFFVVGLGLLIFPDYKTERVMRGEDISELEGINLITKRRWIIVVCAFLAAFGNFLLLRFYY